MDPLSKQTIVFTLYNSKNPLHNEFLKETENKSIYSRILKKYANSKIVHIDISAPESAESPLT